MLEAFFREEFRRIQREALILLDKLALPCNDKEREAKIFVYKLIQARLAEVRAIIGDFETLEMQYRERERAAVREREERDAVHERLLNLSKEINQILDAQRAVRENLIATTSEAERQRLVSLHAELQTRENVAIAQHEAYLKQGMATSL